MVKMIITSLLGGIAVGCLCWSAGSCNLPIVIVAGLCCAVCIFSYMYSGSSKIKALVSEGNDLIKQEIAGKLQISIDNQNKIESTCGTLSKSIDECNENIKNISDFISQYDKMIKELNLKEWLYNWGEKVEKTKKTIEEISSVQVQLKEILAPEEDEGGGINGMLIKLNAIKTISDTADSKLNTLKSNNTELKNIKGSIDESGSKYTSIAKELKINSKKMDEVCIKIAEFNESYSKLLEKLTSEQNRMLAVQRENCELLRVVGDKFRGGKQK